MDDSIMAFFDAWEMTAAQPRLEKIAGAVTDSVRYADPRSPEEIEGAVALSEYVGMFSAGAPGWSAKVVKSDTQAGVTRVTVAFGGPGPDGNNVEQLGQYFVEKDGERITRMIGFVGTGS